MYVKHLYTIIPTKNKNHNHQVIDVGCTSEDNQMKNKYRRVRKRNFNIMGEWIMTKLLEEKCERDSVIHISGSLIHLSFWCLYC